MDTTDKLKELSRQAYTIMLDMAYIIPNVDKYDDVLNILDELRDGVIRFDNALYIMTIRENNNG